jgi:hypothetical protein
MKAIHSITLPAVVLLLCSLLPLQFLPAQSGPAQGKHKHSQSRLLIHLLKMDAAEIAELRQTLERIEGMSPEEKEALGQRVQHLHSMPPEAVDKIYENYQAIPREERDAMQQRWRELSPEARREWRKNLNELEPAERLKRIRESGILPGHRYGGKRSGMPIPDRKAVPPKPPVPPTTALEAPISVPEN